MRDEILDLIDKANEAYKLYGVILFTEAHPFVVKALKDDEFWKAIDVLSGSAWMIFATRLFSGSWEKPTEIAESRGFIRPLWREPSANKELLECFEISDSTRPYFVIFNVDGDKLYYAAHRVRGETAEEVYRSLADVVTSVAKVLEHEPDLPPDALAKALKLRLRILRAKDFLKRAFQFLETARGVTGI